MTKDEAWKMRVEQDEQWSKIVNRKWQGLTDEELRIEALSQAVKYVVGTEMGFDVCVVGMAGAMFRFLKEGIQDEK
jgi:hypothetical protein